MHRLPRHSNRLVTAGLPKMLLTIASLAALAIPLTVPASAGDLEAGRKKVRMCQVCHGLDGIGTNPTVPNLAGESAVYLTKQLKAFRDGERKHAQMSIIAKGLSDEDIDNVTTYYSKIKVQVTLP